MAPGSLRERGLLVEFYTLTLTLSLKGEGIPLQAERYARALVHRTSPHHHRYRRMPNASPLP